MYALAIDVCNECRIYILLLFVGCRYICLSRVGVSSTLHLMLPDYKTLLLFFFFTNMFIPLTRFKSISSFVRGGGDVGKNEDKMDIGNTSIPPFSFSICIRRW